MSKKSESDVKKVKLKAVSRVTKIITRNTN